MPRTENGGLHYEGGTVAEREEAMIRLQQIPNVGPKMAAVQCRVSNSVVFGAFVAATHNCSLSEPSRVTMNNCARDAQGGEPWEAIMTPTSPSDGKGLVHHAYHAARRAINEYGEEDE